MSSLVPFFCVAGYFLNHWKHHLYTNTENDPDYLSFLKRQDLASKLEGPRVLLLGVFCQSLRLTKSPGIVKEYKYPFKATSVRWFAILDVLLMLATTIFYVLLAVHHLQLVVFLIALPYIVTSAYYTIQPYIEHAQVDLSDGDASRSSESRGQLPQRTPPLSERSVP